MPAVRRYTLSVRCIIEAGRSMAPVLLLSFQKRARLRGRDHRLSLRYANEVLHSKPYYFFLEHSYLAFPTITPTLAKFTEKGVPKKEVCQSRSERVFTLKGPPLFISVGLRWRLTTRAASLCTVT